MNTISLFDFRVDTANHTVIITRSFHAGLSLVWDAFTTVACLDAWGAPAPWIAQTRHMDFRVGGYRHYSMISPEGREFWSVQYYTTIAPKTRLGYISNFADSEGRPDPQFKGSENNLVFQETDGITTVQITIQYESLAVLEMMVQRGFKEGMMAALNQLEQLLEK